MLPKQEQFCVFLPFSLQMLRQILVEVGSESKSSPNHNLPCMQERPSSTCSLWPLDLARTELQPGHSKLRHSDTQSSVQLSEVLKLFKQLLRVAQKKSLFRRALTRSQLLWSAFTLVSGGLRTCCALASQLIQKAAPHNSQEDPSTTTTTSGRKTRDRRQESARSATV